MVKRKMSRDLILISKLTVSYYNFANMTNIQNLLDFDLDLRRKVSVINCKMEYLRRRPCGKYNSNEPHR